MLLSGSCSILKKKIHSYYGIWEANFNGCIEVWEVNEDNTRKSISNEEVTMNKFTIKKVEDYLYNIEDTRVSSNFKRDCSGDIPDTKIGHIAKHQLKFIGNDKFVICYSSSGKCLDQFPFIRKQ